MIKKKKNIYEKINEKILEKILEKIKEGVLPWERPWKLDSLNSPRSFVQGRPYRGVNLILLSMFQDDFECPYYATFNQIKQLGGQVIPKSKGIPVVYWYIPKKNEDNEEGEDKKKSFMFAREYTLFNLSQQTGINWKEQYAKDKKKFNSDKNSFNPINEAENIIKLYKDCPPIEFKQQRAFYSPSDDLINMPDINTFKSASELYSTLFHEMAHSTGHKTRLNRQGVSSPSYFGSHEYTKEELVAELSSAYLCNLAGISKKVIDNQASYIRHWYKKLSDNPKLFVQASQQAQKVVDYMQGIKTKSR